MTREVVAVTLLLGCVAVSLAGYLRDHRSRGYRDGRQASRDSVRGFRTFYRWVFLSTPTFGTAAVFGWPAALCARVPFGLFVGGLAASLGGILLFAHAKRVLGAEYSPCFDIHMPRRVITAGAYRWIRHPIYTANVGLMVGLAVVTGSFVVGVSAIVLAGFYAVSARREERSLASEWPEYRDYMGRTGRFLPRWRGGSEPRAA